MINWNDKNKKRLQDLYNSSIKIVDIAKEFNTTYENIVSKASQFGFSKKQAKKWTQEEISFLISKYKQGDYTAKQISKELNRPVSTVRRKIHKYKLSNPNRNKKWSSQEIETLKKEYENKNISECANILKRSKISVKRMVQYLGLSKDSKPYSRFTKEFLSQEMILYNNNIKRIADKYGVLDIDIVVCLERFNLLKKKSKNGKLSNGKHNCWKGFGEIYGHYWSSLIRGAVGRHYIFNIFIEDAWALFLKQNKKCAISGEDLTFATRSTFYDRTASLDRINSQKNYTIDNVQWIHKDIQRIKSDLKESIFFDWINKIYNHQQRIK